MSDLHDRMQRIVITAAETWLRSPGDAHPDALGLHIFNALWAHLQPELDKRDAEVRRLRTAAKLRDQTAIAVAHDLEGQVADAVATLNIEWTDDRTQDALVGELCSHVAAGIEKLHTELERLRQEYADAAAEWDSKRTDLLEERDAEHHLAEQAEAELARAVQMGEQAVKAEADAVRHLEAALRKAERDLTEIANGHWNMAAVNARRRELSDAIRNIRTATVVTLADRGKPATEDDGCDCEAGIVEIGCPVCDQPEETTSGARTPTCGG